jgi:hypothetical protein
MVWWWDKATGGVGWRKLHSEELHDLYPSPSIIRIIKSRRLKWVGNVGPMWRRGDSVWRIGRKAREKETTRETET